MIKWKGWVNLVDVSIIVPETCCQDVDCPLNCDGHCNSITTLLLSLSIGGLPEPLTCDIAI